VGRPGTFPGGPFLLCARQGALTCGRDEGAVFQRIEKSNLPPSEVLYTIMQSMPKSAVIEWVFSHFHRLQTYGGDRELWVKN